MPRVLKEGHLPFPVLLCYAKEDAKLATRFAQHLGADPRLRLVDMNVIKPGALWKQEIARMITEARAVVFLISADFLASTVLAQYVSSILTQRTDLQAQGLLFVGLLRPTIWQRTIFADLTYLQNGTLLQGEHRMMSAAQELIENLEQVGVI